MFFTILSDCSDANESARQQTRVNTLFGCPANILKLGAYSDIEAAGNLVDVLDAGEGKRGVVLVNIAPRFGQGKQWENGVPFGFFHFQDTLVVSVASNEALFLARKLGLVETLQVTDIPEVVEILIENDLLETEKKDYLINTQFRSYEYAPKLAKLVFEGVDVPTRQYSLEDPYKVENIVWFIDTFGNCKTTLLESDITVDSEGFVETRFDKIRFYPKLKDLPDGEMGIYLGSSGIGDQRFVEISVQGGNAAERLGVNVGDRVI